MLPHLPNQHRDPGDECDQGDTYVEPSRVKLGRRPHEYGSTMVEFACGHRVVFLHDEPEACIGCALEAA